MHRVCRWCNDLKIIEEFYTEQDCYCRECRKYYSREWSRENPERRKKIKMKLKAVL